MFDRTGAFLITQISNGLFVFNVKLKLDKRIVSQFGLLSYAAYDYQ